MEDNRRRILKQLARGDVNAAAAVSELRKASNDTSPVLIVVRCSDGLYTIGEDKNLTEEQMKEKVKWKDHVILDEDDALLGFGPNPTIIKGNGVIFKIPDNRR